MEQKLTNLDIKVDALRDRMIRLPLETRAAYYERLDISWIYHENALEGVVLAYSEIKAAIDKKIISDVSLIPMYEEIKAQKATIELMRELCLGKKKPPLTLDLIKRFYCLLTPEEAAKGAPYRRDNPLHRLYYHEIAQPDKIPARMKKLVDWQQEEETRRLHPIERAARTHFQYMSIYPWTPNVGRAGRMIMNYMLLREGYPPAIIHSIERQRYYESLRGDQAGLLSLLIESIAGTVEAAARIISEIPVVTRASRKAS